MSEPGNLTRLPSLSEIQTLSRVCGTLGARRDPLSMDALLTLHNLFALLTVLGGAIARGYAGFSSGLIMVLLLALLRGPIEAIILTLTLGCSHLPR